MDLSQNDSNIHSDRSHDDSKTVSKNKKRAEFLKKVKEGVGKQSIGMPEGNKLISEERKIEEDAIMRINRTPKWKVSGQISDDSTVSLPL